MNPSSIQSPFKNAFLSSFIITYDSLPFTNEEMVKYDQELSGFEQVFLNPDIEKNLISKNELLASFAISKAELSTLTMQEAQEIYNLVLTNSDYDFIRKKLKKEKKLTQKDHDKLEFFNIAKTFRSLNQNVFSLSDLSPEFILNLHKNLTLGMDIFKNYLNDFTVYKSGYFRDNDDIRVGNYQPAPFKEIKNGLKELLQFLKNHQTITGVAVFHTALYALHPFNNGNKRVCRVLEHVLLRSLGINQKNLYSISYYYHQEKPRYYKYLLYSLERKNLNHFVTFIQEALMLSQLSVLKTSLEAKRNEYLSRQTNDTVIKSMLKPLIKRQELQFKNLFKNAKNKMARQTFVSNLQKATDNGIVTKRESGRAVYYSLSAKNPEEEIISNWLSFFQKRLGYIPEGFLLV